MSATTSRYLRASILIGMMVFAVSCGTIGSSEQPGDTTDVSSPNQPVSIADEHIDGEPNLSPRVSTRGVLQYCGAAEWSSAGISIEEQCSTPGFEILDIIGGVASTRFERTAGRLLAIDPEYSLTEVRAGDERLPFWVSDHLAFILFHQPVELGVRYLTATVSRNGSDFTCNLMQVPLTCNPSPADRSPEFRPNVGGEIGLVQNAFR